jgi:protease I
MHKRNNLLQGRKVAILAADGVSESQLFSAKKNLEEAGAEVIVVSLELGKIKSWTIDHWGKCIDVDATLDNACSEDFDALLIPGEEMNNEKIITNKKAIEFVKNFINEGKSIASICHGTKFLIKSGLAKGKTLTSWPSLKKDLIKSGAKWKDEEVVAQNGFISSRCPDDNMLFTKKMIEGFSISPRCRKSPSELNIIFAS